MKIAPVSADLLIKLALTAAAVGLAVVVYKKLTGQIDDTLKTLSELPGKVWAKVTSVTDDIIAAPGQVADAVILSTTQAGQGWQLQYQPQTPAMQEATGRKYNGPLITNDGMDFSPFGGLSG